MTVAGGIVGDSEYSLAINECYNSGTVIGKSITYIYIGGILGRHQVSGEFSVQGCYSKGNVEGEKHMKKQNKNTQSGITLIALIITIIILLILSAVTIKLVLNGGILTRTKTSAEEQIVAQEKEYISLAYSEYNMSKINNTDYTMQEALDAQKAGATAEGDEILGWSITFEKTSNQYTLNSDGSIDEGIPNRWDGKTTETPEITEENSWHIYTSEQLKYFADFVNGELTEEEKGNLSITEDTIVYLEADLDLGARANEKGEKVVGSEWTPIGIETTSAFVGTFEGNNHYITGIYVNIEGNFGGIFGNSNTIKNLTIKNSYIKGANCSGGIVGALRTGTIENCHNINAVVNVDSITAGGVVGQLETKAINCSNTGNVSGNKQTGGVAGYASNSSTISSCYNTGNVSGDKNTGGVAGYARISSTISNCYNTGNVSGNEFTGGVAGYAYNSSTISSCYNTGNVSGDNYTGGVAGYAHNFSTISSCYNTGNVSGDNYTGGVISGVYTSSNISNCYNIGTVTGNGKRIGGIVGNAGPSSIISSCYNTGDVTGNATENESNIGGIAGITFGTIDNCYNTASITGNGGAVGGILGQIGVGTSGVSTDIKNCYNLGTISGNDFIGGIIGWTSETKALGTIENNYNAGEIKGKDSVGGIIGRNSYKFVVKNCYNKGTIEGKTQVGTIIGNQTSSNVTNLSRMYYLNTINLSAIGNAETPETVRSIDNNFNSLEEFLNWLKNN